MKSKKLTALVLAAVMSFSALSISALLPQPVGITASAAASGVSVVYSPTGDDVVLPDLTATVTFTKELVEGWWNKDNNARIQVSLYDNNDGLPVGTEKYWIRKRQVGDASGGYYKIKELSNDVYQSLKERGIDDAYAKIDDIDNYAGNYQLPSWTAWGDYADLNYNQSSCYGLYVFYGWRCTTNGSGRCSDKDKILKERNFDVEVKPIDGGSRYQATFGTVVKIAANEEEMAANYQAEQEAAAKKKAEQDANNAKVGHQNNKRASSNATNNAVNANGVFAKNNGEGDAKPVYITSSKNLKGEGRYTASDAQYLFNMVNLAKDEIGLLYDIDMPSGWTLLPGKNALVTLNMDGDHNYNLNKYRVFIYHLKNGKVYSVSGVSKRQSYLLFAANDFSPYVVVLAPADRKRRDVAISGAGTNPPTADASALPVMLLAAASLSASGSVIMRRKRLSNLGSV